MTSQVSGLGVIVWNARKYRKPSTWKRLACVVHFRLLYAITKEREIMSEEDYDYFTMSVRDSLGIILWSSVGTLVVVGSILAVAL
jgi:hypothetical protein